MEATFSEPKIRKKREFLSNSKLVLFAFASAFFPRILDSLGAPSVINFLHFLVIPFALAVVLSKGNKLSKRQRSIISELLFGLFLLLTVIIASALLNGAGEVNVILGFLLLAEPFILVTCIISLVAESSEFEKFRKWLSYFWIFHIMLAMVQRYIFKVHLMNTGLAPSDGIQGVFFLTGAGHVVGASVSFSFAAYYLLHAKASPIWMRLGIAALAMWQLLLSDAKQVLLAFMVAGVLLLFLKVQDIGKVIQYLIFAIVFGLVFNWCLQNLSAFSAFNVWMKPELYGPNGDATMLKTSVFRVIPQHYESPLNWLLGLGPGHTVGRLGGWLLRKYQPLFGSFSTLHQASSDVWREVASYYIGSRSSMFSPLFGWAGIWGDLGFLGLGAYLYLASIVWRRLCTDDLCRFLLLTVVVFGCIFSQMEEPGYMLSIAAIISLRWQEDRLAKMHMRAKRVMHLLSQG
ncbi:MAG: hypothetical protein AAFW84_24900 [Cyanobacteria bacterium J06635_15]